MASPTRSNLRSLLKHALILLFVFSYATAYCEEGDNKAQAGITYLDRGWFYRWDDPNIENQPELREMVMPGWASDRGDSRYLVQQIQLPQDTYTDPVIFIPGVFLFYETYLGDTKIFGNDDIGNPDDLEITGFAWQMIELPSGYEGKQLTFRIQSDYYLIGIGGLPILGSRANIYRWIFVHDGIRIIIATLSGFIALVSCMLFIGFRKLPEFLYLGFFSLCAGIYVFNYTFTKDFLIDRPDLWLYVWIFTIFLLPFGILGYVRAVFGRGRRDILRFLFLAHLIFSAMALPVGLGFPMIAGNIVLILIRVLYVIYVPVVIVSVLRVAPKRHTDVVIFITGFTILTGCGVGDVIVGLGLVPWYRPILYIGMFCFVSSLALIVARRSVASFKNVAEFSRQLSDFGKERERMIGELHDGIGGLMTNINLIAEIGISSKPREERIDTFSTIASLSRDGLDEIREFMQSIDDDERTWNTLAANLRLYGTETLEPHDIKVTFEADIASDVDRPTSIIYLNISRIYHEALTNIAKHANATRADVSLTVNRNHVEFSICDDGDGLDERTRRTGRGLETMRKRIEEIGGNIAIDSETGVSLLFTISPINTRSEG